jgi:hypothetical protein
LGWKAEAITDAESASMTLAFTEELPISYPSNSIIPYLSSLNRVAADMWRDKLHNVCRKGIKVRNIRLFAKTLR